MDAGFKAVQIGNILKIEFLQTNQKKSPKSQNNIVTPFGLPTPQIEMVSKVE